MPNGLTLGNLFPGSVPKTDQGLDGMYDYSNHGEFVARVAAGSDYGVAKNADLYIIKYRQGYINGLTSNLVTPLSTPSAVDDAFAHAIDDAIASFTNGAPRKVVINFSAGKLHITTSVCKKAD